jgi:stage II sporulation protein P
MINFAVINLKNLIKNLLKLTIIILLVIGMMNIYDLLLQKSKKLSYIEILKENLELINIPSTSSNKNVFSNIIKSEIPLLAINNEIDKIEYLTSVSTDDSDSINTEEETSSVLEENSNTEENNLSHNLTTTVISENNLSESYNISYGSVKIKNETDYYLSESILEPNVEYTDTKNILIFHTHTCESYTQTEANSYTASGNFRTTDLTHSVAQVGTILTECLSSKGYNVNHSLNYHDYPAYNGSYSRSLSTVTSLLKSAPTTELVIDLHRDAVGSMSEYAPRVQIGDETVAQLMFVIGTNGGGLKHDNWQTNLKYAIKIQEKANELYPGLFRPIIVRNSRYNQNLTSSACIIEVGATGNTLEEASGSMKYLAEVISEVMK